MYTVQPEAQSVYLALGVNNPGEYTTGSICFDDVIWENGTPLLAVNYADGRPGSFFTFTGANFPPNSTASLIVNGFTLTNALAIDSSGGFLVLLNTSQADPGYYSVTAAVNPSATTSFVLDPNWALRPQEGDGPIANVPSGIAWKVQYLPLIRR